jgi:hypothetical protein
VIQFEESIGVWLDDFEGDKNLRAFLETEWYRTLPATSKTQIKTK